MRGGGASLWAESNQGSDRRGSQVSFVIDASVTMTWYFEDEATQATKELLDAAARD